VDTSVPSGLRSVPSAFCSWTPVKELRIEPAVNPAFARRYTCSRFYWTEPGAAALAAGPRRRLATLTELANQMGDRPFWPRKCATVPRSDLVEFLVAIPPDQLKRARESRFLMRRALAHLLPPEVLRRRTKGGAGRCYIVMVQRQWNELEAIFRRRSPRPSDFSMQRVFWNPCANWKNGILTHSTFQLLNGIKLELWLRDVARRGSFTSRLKNSQRSA